MSNNDRYKKQIKKLSEEVVDCLGIDLTPIEYENLEIDDSILIIKPISKIVINIEYENKFVKILKNHVEDGIIKM